MSCLGDFVISLYMFKLYEKHFIINHCLTLELCKYLKKKTFLLSAVLLVEGLCGSGGALRVLLGRT